MFPSNHKPIYFFQRTFPLIFFMKSPSPTSQKFLLGKALEMMLISVDSPSQQPKKIVYHTHKILCYSHHP